MQQSFPFGWRVLLLLWLTTITSLVTAKDSKKRAEKDETPLNKDFANNVFTDLGP